MPIFNDCHPLSPIHHLSMASSQFEFKSESVCLYWFAAVILSRPDCLTPKHRQMSYLNASILLASIVILLTMLKHENDNSCPDDLILKNCKLHDDQQTVILYYSSLDRLRQFWSSSKNLQRRSLQTSLMRLATGSRKNCS